MRKVLCLYLFFCSCTIFSQQPQKLNSSEIYKELQKLNFLGSVLYVAAHPDDENTRLLSYLSNDLHARTAYLSLTRGDGGQNLVGPELRELLGVLRTQELLKARSIDGAEQYFTRANDFGYSKTPEETLSIWEKEQVLKDVVRLIRKYQPDIIINRFHTASGGETHGHHTSSAILSAEAFELAGKETVFPEMAEDLGTWQPEKLFFNTSPWFYSSQEAFEKADKSNFISFDTGVYFPLLGLSNPEIASLSRSQHKSQGFGSTGTRGSQTEYLELIKGSHPKGAEELFAGINTSWSRLSGGEEIGLLLDKVLEEYNFRNPAASVPDLLEVLNRIQSLENDHWRTLKTQQVKQIIASAAGLYLEAVAEEASASPGESVPVHLEAINRSNLEINLLSVRLLPAEASINPEFKLDNNQLWKKELILDIDKAAPYSSAYWLVEEGDLGLYKVPDESLIGLPDTPAPYQARFIVEINGQKLDFLKPVVYKYNDPVQGEVYQPFEIIPPVSLLLDKEVIIFSDSSKKSVSVHVTAMSKVQASELSIKETDNWEIEPEYQEVPPLKEGETAVFQFTVKPKQDAEVAALQPVLSLGEREYSQQIVYLDYDHIPTQTIVKEAIAKLISLDLEKRGKSIAYIQGAGDVIPDALLQMGYELKILQPEDISRERLKAFDAVVLGIRAYNVHEQLQEKQDELFEYVKEGGNLVVQYNTNRDLQVHPLAPFSLDISRGRVTDENAEVRFLHPEHPVLNEPNEIRPEDFEGWVQERGLYFPDQWSSDFTPILEMNDTGESPLKGALLIAEYGKGNYIYTGLSFFRQFPAGVPGAYRLFSNLLSLSKNP